MRRPFDMAGSLRRVLRHLLPLLAALLIGMVFYLGIHSERTGFVEQVLDPGLKRISKPVLNAFRGRPPRLTELSITLLDADLDSLERSVERMITDGPPGPEPTVLLPGELRVGTRTMSIRIGPHPWPVTVGGERERSLAIHLSGQDSLMGMRSFVVSPVTSGRILFGWQFRQALLDEGIPVVGWGLADMQLNDRKLGLHLLEGLPDQFLADHPGHDAGPLMRFDDGLLQRSDRWIEDAPYFRDRPRQADWLSAPILALRSPTGMNGPDADPMHARAVQALEGFRSGRRSPSEVFDTGALARLLALSDLFGAQASISWWNLCFLTDGPTGKLLAVPLRTLAGDPIPAPLAMRIGSPVRSTSGPTEMLGRMLGDQQLYETYIQFLDTFTRPGWLEAFVHRHAGDFSLDHRILRSELPHLEYDRDILLHDRNVVLGHLRPRDLVLAYAGTRADGRRRLAVANVHGLPVVVTAVISGTDTVMLQRSITLAPRERDKPLTYRAIDVDLPGTPDGPLEVRVHLQGLQEMAHVRARQGGILAAN